MKIREFINRVIVFLTLSDIFVYGPIAIASPVLGIFLQDVFLEKTVLYVGIATAIFFLSRAIVQIPIGLFCDKIKHDTDEIYVLVIGCFIMGFSYILIPFIREPWQYFTIMAFEGLGSSMNLNSWRKLFARNLDVSHEGVGYGFYETILSLSTALICIIGGYFSSLNKNAFATVIIIIGASIMLGGLVGGFIITFKDRKSKKM